ncbi:head decoration protein [Buttiauxella ferragutiae ATCC 51602]|uniref:Head decoration protein n=1 Tax=Buttiauxella ferragutiae ATCC 51602 TaxID=1354252 RepID=A0ABX2W6Y9_9ENTR|nr:head decoration protein [Buttiauxella ferragutiae]OAT26718.1 head decoration protein [Buttiauxella ferragutiae ATCC 51602]
MSTETEVRGDHHVFAGSDPAYTAIGSVAFISAMPALTPLMLDATAGVLVSWDGVNAGQAVAVLALDHNGTAGTGTYYKSGTFDMSAIVWPEDVDIVKKRNAFVGSAISVA